MPLKKKKKLSRKPAKKKAIKKAAKKKAIKKPARKKILKKVSRKAVKKAKKPAIKKTALKRKAAAGEKVVGVITHYFPHVCAAVLKVKIPIAVGDTIKVKGHTTDFTQKVTSMQIDRSVITVAKKGDEIGLQVDSRVRKQDVVTKV